MYYERHRNVNRIDLSIHIFKSLNFIRFVIFMYTRIQKYLKFTLLHGCGIHQFFTSEIFSIFLKTCKYFLFILDGQSSGVKCTFRIGCSKEERSRNSVIQSRHFLPLKNPRHPLLYFPLNAPTAIALIVVKGGKSKTCVINTYRI